MFIDRIDGVGSMANLDKTQNGFIDNTEIQGGQFADLISDKLNQINEVIHKSETLFESYLKGDNVATHDLMISMGKAKHELQLIVEIRNKLLESYQEITRIQL